MAIEHKTLPVGGVQFHPESLMSLGGEVGLRIVENAFRLGVGVELMQSLTHVIPGWCVSTRAASDIGSDSGFNASHCPGMTKRWKRDSNDF